MDELAQLNPQIVETIIGTKKLKKVKIYPLSMADQLKFTAMIVEAIQLLTERTEESNLKFAATIRTVISENLGKILTFVTDEGEPLMDDITNVQAVEIAEIIYSVNYEVLEKKVQSLIEKIRKAFLSPKSVHPSSEDIPNINSNTSSEEDTEKEESQ